MRALGYTLISSFFLLSLIPPAASQGINPIRCELADSGKRIRILGSNPTSQIIRCTATCEAPAQNGSTRSCQMQSQAPVQPGDSNVELANCFDDNNAAHPPTSESHSCF